MIYTASVTRDGNIVASLSRDSRPYGQAEANDYPGCVLTADGAEYLPTPPPEPLGTTPRTQALRPEEIAAAREAIAQAEEQARRSTSTVLRDALLLLSATFDGVLAKLGGEQ